MEKKYSLEPTKERLLDAGVVGQENLSDFLKVPAQGGLRFLMLTRGDPEGLSTTGGIEFWESADQASLAWPD